MKRLVFVFGLIFTMWGLSACSSEKCSDRGTASVEDSGTVYKDAKISRFAH